MPAWSGVAHNFRADWQMLWKEIAIGFLVAGFVAQLPDSFFTALFVTNAPAPIPAIENAIVGPLIAVLSFVCSIGNVPLAAVLWSGGISFAGVLSFLYADLIVLPIVVIYRKYYGRRFASRITALMFVTMVVAALVVAGAMDLAGLIPSGPRPSRAGVFGEVGINYKLALNLLGVAIFAAMMWLTHRRGVTDPVCGMRVDRDRAVTRSVDGRTVRFCSEGCAATFAAGQVGDSAGTDQTPAGDAPATGVSGRGGGGSA
jgi:hypothetical protein